MFATTRLRCRGKLSSRDHLIGVMVRSLTPILNKAQDKVHCEIYRLLHRPRRMCVLSMLCVVEDCSLYDRTSIGLTTARRITFESNSKRSAPSSTAFAVICMFHRFFCD